MPVGFTRIDVGIRLNKVRLLRNRINHNDPICFNKNTIDFSVAQEVYFAIYEVLDWIDPELKRFLKELDKVKMQITRARKI